MKVSQNVDGKMFVLVDNSNNHERPNSDSPPTIGRLLAFDFSSSTDSATQEVSFGEWEELQYQSKYCVISSSIANTRLSNPSSIALTTPETLFGTGCQLSFSMKYEVESITFEHDTEPFLLDPPRLFFTTPAAGIVTLLTHPSKSDKDQYRQNRLSNSFH
ncbi:hypothetical protein BLNAU_22403 [Blattamonas nauphoetae]|uniref:Uncharacterized protein n=1 Tax=Blattamonas nauphoetae TaxID=2049346 RepID=A0ABQ9WT62_9EUKA|nr:hypothetical protein BLNAU_22403 [Blattamonas nauphoetae]